MKYDKDMIISIIDAVIDGDKPLLEWDYLVYVKHKEPFADYWGARLRDIELKFRGQHGKMITEEGVDALRNLRKELART